LDFEIKNAAFNWNQKFSLIGNKMKTNDLDVEIDGRMIWKNKKGRIDFDDKICLEDIAMKFSKGNSQFMEIYNGVVRVEGALMIKNGQFYNECFTLDPNSIKLEECIFRTKKVNMYLENTNMTFDSHSHIKFGDSKIGEDSGLIISSKGGNILRIGDELSWEADSCKIKWGGYDASGGKIIVATDDWYMGQKDGRMYHNGRQLLRIFGEEIEERKVDKLWGKIKDKFPIEVFVERNWTGKYYNVIAPDMVMSYSVWEDLDSRHKVDISSYNYENGKAMFSSYTLDNIKEWGEKNKDRIIVNYSKVK
jgi:hypothetical protein